jgi:hypothetical protein
MVFFSEKTSSFVRFFGGQKTETKWSTKATDPVWMALCYGLRERPK